VSEETGVYHDLGGSGESLSVFNLAIRLGAYSDFPSALAGLAERYGVASETGTVSGRENRTKTALKRFPHGFTV
jgi:hypothetical protein